MENVIRYYYGLNVNNIRENDGIYFFDIDDKKFIFREYTGNNINDIYSLNNFLMRYIKVDKIILNKDGNLISGYLNKGYVLILKGDTYMVSLPLISYMASLDISSYKSLMRNNWELLWEERIDYYERQIGENEKRFPLIRESFDYFVGLGENAISYLVNTKIEVKEKKFDDMVIAHNNLFSSLGDLFNIILDHKSRDVAEYVKLSFFNGNREIFSQLEEYFYHNFYSLYGMRVLYARIIYPSYYFKLYDDIVSGKKDEKELNTIIDKVYEYQVFLYRMGLFLKKFYDIPIIEWTSSSH